MGRKAGSVRASEAARRRRHQVYLDRELAEHRDTGSVLALWRAYGISSSLGQAPPRELIPYLDALCDVITDFSLKPPRSGAAIGLAFAKALGFSEHGAGTPFSRAWKAEHQLIVTIQVFDEYERNREMQALGKEPTHSWETIFSDVASRHRCEYNCPKRMTWKAVQKIWLKNGRQIVESRKPDGQQTNDKSRKLSELLR